MKQHWQPIELEQEWTLSDTEMEFICRQMVRTRLAFALQLKHLELEGSLPNSPRDFPAVVVAFVAAQLAVGEHFIFDITSRTTRRHRAEIREFLEYRAFSSRDHRSLRGWLLEEAIDLEPRRDRLVLRSAAWCRKQRVEPPGARRLDEIIGSALRAHEKDLFAKVAVHLTDETRGGIDRLLTVEETTDVAPMQRIRSDPGRLKAKTIEAEVEKLKTVEDLALPAAALAALPRRVVEHYRARVESEPPSRTRRHPPEIRYPQVAIYCWLRRQEILDSLVELLLQTVKKLARNAERRVKEELLDEIERVSGRCWRSSESAAIWSRARVSLNPSLSSDPRTGEFLGAGPQRCGGPRGGSGGQVRQNRPETLRGTSTCCSGTTSSPVADRLGFLRAAVGSMTVHRSQVQVWSRPNGLRAPRFPPSDL